MVSLSYIGKPTGCKSAVDGLLWEQEDTGSIPVTPIVITTTIMIEITQQEFEDNYDAYMDRVEQNQETFLIRLPDGRGVVMAPVDDETKEIFDTVIEENHTQ